MRNEVVTLSGVGLVLLLDVYFRLVDRNYGSIL